MNVDSTTAQFKAHRSLLLIIIHKRISSLSGPLLSKRMKVYFKFKFCAASFNQKFKISSEGGDLSY